MAKVSFNKTEKDAIIQKIQQYFEEDLNQEISSIDAGFLLKFFAEEIGPHFYNLALRDAQAILSRRMDDIASAIDELTRPTGPRT